MRTETPAVLVSEQFGFNDTLFLETAFMMIRYLDPVTSCLGLKPGSVTYQLCGLGQVT